MHVFLSDQMSTQKHEADLGEMSILPERGDHVIVVLPQQDDRAATRVTWLVTGRTFEQRSVMSAVRVPTPLGVGYARGPVDQWVCVLSGERQELGPA